jgi:amino acid transporter
VAAPRLTSTRLGAARLRAIGDGADTLKHGALSTLDLAGTSAAVVAPAYSIYTTAAFLVLGVGIGSPLVVLFAGIAFLCYGNSAAQFTRKIPGAGTTVAFFGVTSGGVAGSAVAFTFLVTVAPVRGSGPEPGELLEGVA